ncbi:signal recognition particle-docking protein FtsY [Candidatus Pacearchaeota archaeon]|nr:signal recognition particle-docking protein FtsY [Candidatus Pacearchaeota archaeon]
MFGFLKNKLKEWVGKAKDNLKQEEIKELPKIEPTKKTKEKVSKEKIAALSKSKDFEPTYKKAAALSDLKKSELTTKIIEKAKKKKIKEVPTQFNNAQETYQPDIDEIKKSLATAEDIKKVQEEIKKTQEIALKVEKQQESPKQAIQELEEKRKESEETFEKKEKTGFLKKLFGKKEEDKPISREDASQKTSDSSELNSQKFKISEPLGIGDKEPTIQKSFLEKVRQTFIYKITEEDFNSLFEGLEMLLLENNVSLEATESIKSILSKKLIGKEIKKESLEQEIKKELKETLNEILVEPDDPLEIIKLKKEKPFVILFFGINGTGKTTSIAKLASILKSNNISVVLAAADTFRAASIEQISEHAKILEIPLIRHEYGSDPAAVGFDAIKYAKAHGIDVVLIDTAGRMHTKTNLMSEMQKIVKVTNPDLKIFVAESIAGNDATEQAKIFHESINIDGTILSKADIDEKGGTIISISAITRKPIFYLGTGQNYSDLKLFNKQEFIESLGLE